MSIKEKFVQAIEKIKFKTEQEPQTSQTESDGFTSVDNPKPQAEYFKSKPIMITVAVIVFLIILAVVFSPRIGGNSNKESDKYENKKQTEYQDVDNTKNLPSSYGEIKKYNDRVNPVKGIEEKQEAQREQKKQSYRALPPTPPEVPKQKDAQRNINDRLSVLLKEKEAANKSPIEFKVNK